MRVSRENPSPNSLVILAVVARAVRAQSTISTENSKSVPRARSPTHGDSQTRVISTQAYNLLRTSPMRQLSLLREKKYKKRKTARLIATRRGSNHVILKSRRPLLRKHRTLVLRSIRETQ